MDQTRTNSTEQKRQAVTLRLDHDLHEALRTYTFHTRRSANDLLTQLLREYLAGDGRDELRSAVVRDTQERHQVALDKLKG